MNTTVRNWIKGSVSVGLLVASFGMPVVATVLAYDAGPKFGSDPSSTAPVPMQFLSGASESQQGR